MRLPNSALLKKATTGAVLQSCGKDFRDNPSAAKGLLGLLKRK